MLHFTGVYDNPGGDGSPSKLDNWSTFTATILSRDVIEIISKRLSNEIFRMTSHKIWFDIAKKYYNIYYIITLHPLLKERDV